MRRFLRRRRRDAGSLTHCLVCASDSVIPVEWDEQEGNAWWMRLRCGACGSFRDVDAVPHATAQRYDLELDRGVGLIANALRRLERERMSVEAETFATALRLDLVDATDFAVRRGSDGVGQR
jgi:hypothetical protein